MWPELLKQLRSGLVFNPLDELQKRATQYGTGIGENLQAQHAQAGYAKTHPKSQRAQTEALSNAVMLALSIWKPIEGVAPEHLAKINKALPETVIAPAMANKKSGMFNTGNAHFEAVPGLIRAGHEPDTHGWLTSLGRIVSDAKAYKLAKKADPTVQGRVGIKDGLIDDRSQTPKLTSGDFKAPLDSIAGRIVGSIAPKSGKDPGGLFKSGLPEKVGKEAPPIYGHLPKGKVSGYIQPASVDEALKLDLRNQVAKDIEKEKPSKPGLALLDSIVDPAALRGYGRAITARDQRLDEFRKVDSTWNVAYNAWKSVAKQAHDEPTTRRTELADALRGGPKPPKGEPALMGAYGHPDYIPTVDAVKYAKRLPHQFTDALIKSQAAGNLFYGAGTKDYLAPHRTINSKAIDIEMAARRVIQQAQEGVFVPPHATPAEAATIIGHGTHPSRHIDPDVWAALEAAMKAARFLHLK